MFRVAAAAFGVAVVASIVSGGNSAVILVGFFGTIAFFVWALLSGRARLTCPYCFKRVKLAAPVCHHCGRQVANPRRVGAPAIDPMALSKECPFCKQGIRPDASVCPHCQRESPAWTLKDGHWWRQDESGKWLWWDPKRETWFTAEP